jgi:hypothetical protein
MNDPRPNLISDSAEWTKLLNAAENTNKELAGTLHGFRCSGARLTKTSQGYIIEPDLNPKSSKWLTKAAYVIDRDKWLVPYKDELIKLLDGLEGAA